MLRNLKSLVNKEIFVMANIFIYPTANANTYW